MVCTVALVAEQRMNRQHMTDNASPVAGAGTGPSGSRPAPCDHLHLYTHRRSWANKSFGQTNFGRNLTTADAMSSVSRLKAEEVSGQTWVTIDACSAAVESLSGARTAQRAHLSAGNGIERTSRTSLSEHKCRL
jgi:hypothetical protein